GETTPLAEQVESTYDGLKERIRHREWRVDKTLAEHHRRAPELESPTGATNSSAPRKQHSRK
ncbi:IS481 family transposase, partial [Paraburkholderia aspalathi]|nr:IS481 family transposase [Paraburkholderia aspalathi]MBK3824195.1 IS481 family transposase [Paraburkholderia aspalathi]MBK3835661.1 IS481 family transposase [Paraburkholderia aspalathi]MBK3836035.1 IS481 family transposase [Paraburkholderia aspalathi]MBK3865412.1 IS481 family transposase [Paraburkholderia aspalathi]